MFIVYVLVVFAGSKNVEFRIISLLPYIQHNYKYYYSRGWSKLRLYKETMNILIDVYWNNAYRSVKVAIKSPKTYKTRTNIMFVKQKTT